MEGFPLSYVNKMCLKMMAWCLWPTLFAVLAAWPLSVVLELPEKMGGVSPFPDSSSLVVLAGAAVALVLGVYQSIRLWLWEHGKSDDCFTCGCLLGREQDGRWGPYRKCLGCGENHPMNQWDLMRQGRSGRR